VIHAPGSPDPPVPRLLAEVEAAPSSETLVVSTGTADTWQALDSLLAEWAGRPGARVLVLGTVGTHRDARAARLRALWTIEEKARATGLPALVLRLAPILGPRSPLWLRLRAGGSLPRADRALLQPVAEEDVQATLAAACLAQEDWSGWYDVAGPDAMSLDELAALAGRDPSLPRGAGAWEPSPEELAEQGMCDPRPWSQHFRITPRRVIEEAPQWA
jgi:uncharacterized protein YbjT (DUF2867 family)